MIRRKLVTRFNRRRPDPSQLPVAGAVACVVTSTGTTNVTLTFDRPVVVNGTFGNTVETLTLVSQTVVSPTVVTQVWSGNVATHDWAIPSNDPAIRSTTGGYVASATGTFS